MPNKEENPFTELVKNYVSGQLETPVKQPRHSKRKEKQVTK